MDESIVDKGGRLGFPTTGVGGKTGRFGVSKGNSIWWHGGGIQHLLCEV